MAVYLRVKRKIYENPVEIFDTQLSAKRINWDPSVRKGTKFKYIGTSQDTIDCSDYSTEDACSSKPHLTCGIDEKNIMSTVPSGSRKLILNLRDHSAIIDPSETYKPKEELTIVGCKRFFTSLSIVPADALKNEKIQSEGDNEPKKPKLSIEVMTPLMAEKCFPPSVTTLPVIDLPHLPRAPQINMAITLNNLVLTEHENKEMPSSTISNVVSQYSDSSDRFVFDFYRSQSYVDRVLLSQDRDRNRPRPNKLGSNPRLTNSQEESEDIEYDDELFRSTGYVISRPNCGIIEEAASSDCDSDNYNNENGEDSDSNDEFNWRNDYPEEDLSDSDRSTNSDSDSSEGYQRKINEKPSYWDMKLFR